MEPVYKEYNSEEVSKCVNAAYNSVNIINSLKSKETLTEKETLILADNEKHVRIMMGKVWFVAGLTNEQITELQAI